MIPSITPIPHYPYQNLKDAKVAANLPFSSRVVWKEDRACNRLQAISNLQTDRDIWWQDCRAVTWSVVSVLFFYGTILLFDYSDKIMIAAVSWPFAFGAAGLSTRKAYQEHTKDDPYCVSKIAKERQQGFNLGFCYAGQKALVAKKILHPQELAWLYEEALFSLKKYTAEMPSSYTQQTEWIVNFFENNPLSQKAFSYLDSATLALLPKHPIETFAKEASQYLMLKSKIEQHPVTKQNIHLYSAQIQQIARDTLETWKKTPHIDVLPTTPIAVQIADRAESVETKIIPVEIDPQLKLEKILNRIHNHLYRELSVS
jgi:hypothetical protein